MAVSRHSSVSNPCLVTLTLIVLLQAALAQPFGVEVGQQAPEFTLIDLAGEPISLSDFRGTPVILNFWATWCPPCREEMPLFQRVHDELSDSETPVQVFLVDLSEGRDEVKAFLDVTAITLPVGLDVSGERDDLPDTVIPTVSVFRVYRAVGLPTTYFIDAEGVIRAKKVGQVLEPELSTLLSAVGVPWSP